MMQGPQAHFLPDGRRLHLNHGPIDLILQADGPPEERRVAFEQATRRFGTVLSELVSELPDLRSPASPVRARPFAGKVAARMERAVQPFAATFITPMAAVAGAVADEILETMKEGARLDRAMVNNGGDCALYLAPGESLAIAIAGTGNGLEDRVAIGAGDGIGGVATSGWRGRSHSLGIADAVTVLAETAAEADAAATLIANAVDVPGHAAIRRLPACELSPDSDLGDRLVTIDVGALALQDIVCALARGRELAESFLAQGRIAAAALFLCDDCVVVGPFPLLPALAPPVRQKRDHRHG